MTVIERLGELQEEFFAKTGKLYENIELLGNEFYNLMLKDVMEVYKQESKLLLSEVKIDYNAANYKLDCMDDMKSPARWWFFGWHRNEPASLTYREIYAQVQADFNKRTAALERLEAALEEATENASPTDEPQEPTATDSKPTSKTKPQKPADGQETDKGNAQTQDTAPNTPLTAKKKAVKP